MEPISWHFHNVTPGEMNEDPMAGEFFSRTELATIADALVRESIQNSLDASSGNGMVSIRIAFSTSAHPPEQVATYLDGLWPHVQAVMKAPGSCPEVDTPVDYVVLEDFGTKGLEGDEAQWRDDPEGSGTKNHFYYFWRNVGRGQKSDKDRGRWGLGKTVFPASSRLHSFFGVTRRKNDPDLLLMGQSVLKIHEISDQPYRPYGYFANLDSQQLQLPVRDPVFTSGFEAVFGLRRDASTGLSIVIPYPVPELSPDAVLRACLNHYYFMLMTGELEITVEHNDRVVVLAKNTIIEDSFLAELGWSEEERENMEKLLTMAQESLTLPEQDRILLKNKEGTPYWSPELFPEDSFGDLVDKLNHGRLIALRVPISISTVAGVTAPSYFDVYLQRDETFKDRIENYIRSGVIISGVYSGIPKGFRALVVIEDRPLASFLGDAENPSHTTWEKSSSKFQGKYKTGPTCLKFVRYSPNEILKILSAQASDLDKEALKKVFWIETPEGVTTVVPKPAAKNKPGKITPIVPPIPKPSPQAIVVDRHANGFRVYAKPGVDGLPDEVLITVAYSTRKGNSFSKYSPFDFNLADGIQLEWNSADIIECSRNQMRVRVIGNDFSVTASGFDTNRDLSVRVIPRKESHEADV